MSNAADEPQQPLRWRYRRVHGRLMCTIDLGAVSVRSGGK